MEFLILDFESHSNLYNKYFLLPNLRRKEVSLNDKFHKFGYPDDPDNTNQIKMISLPVVDPVFRIEK